MDGLVEQLCLTGSLALGDYQHGVSDVDFVAFTSRRPSDDDLHRLAEIHNGLPRYDGVYLGREALRTTPDSGEVVPHVVNGAFRTDQPCDELNPVLWLTVARYGIAVRGPAPADLGLRVDAERLRRWNLDNLADYWRSLAGENRAVLATRTEDAEANAIGVVWAVLGPARLHYTLATGDITTKSGAGRYAMEHFPAWTELTRRALRWRQGHRDGVRFVTADGHAAAAMVEAIVDDAWVRWG